MKYKVYDWYNVEDALKFDAWSLSLAEFLGEADTKKEADKIIKQRVDDTDGECCCEIVETSRIKVIKED